MGDDPHNVDVLVVGGGATGLATAIGLAQSGVSTAIAGVPENPRDDGRSAALFQSSLEFLGELGLAEALKSHGAPLRAIRIIDVTGALVRAPTVTFKAVEIGQEAFGWNIANADIVRVMAAAARATAGLRVSSAFFDGMSGEGARKRVSLSDGTFISARLVVASDGQKSRVREAAGIGVSTRPYPQAAITCRLWHPGDHEDISREFHTREGPFTLVPAGDHASALVWIVQPAKAEAMMAMDRAALVTAITRQSASALGSVTIDGPIGCVPLQKLLANALVADRVALVGEAAHAFPPIGAQGLNLGFKDVEALVRRVSAAVKAGADPGGDCLAGYARDRRLDVDMRSKGVDLLNSALIADALPADLARAFGLAAMRDIAPLRQLMMRIGGWSNLLGPAKAS